MARAKQVGLGVGALAMINVAAIVSVVGTISKLNSGIIIIRYTDGTFETLLN